MKNSILSTWDREYKKGFLSYLVLLMIKEGAGYGYEIFRKLSGKIDLQISGIYHILKRLEKQGLVSFKWHDSIKGPKRKYYTATPQGEKTLRAFTYNSIKPIMETVNGLIVKHFPETDKEMI